MLDSKKSTHFYIQRNHYVSDDLPFLLHVVYLNFVTLGPQLLLYTCASQESLAEHSGEHADTWVFLCK